MTAGQRASGTNGVVSGFSRTNWINRTERLRS
jgi:hypothetical protein